MSHRTTPSIVRSRLRRRAAAAVLASGLTIAVGALAIPGGPASAAPSPATPTASSVIGLKKGAYGENVVALQNALNRVGIGVKYGVDGYFGSATQASVKAFQNYKHLPVTGVVDAATAAALGFTTSTPAAASPAASTSAGSGVQAGVSGPAVVQLQQAITRIGWPLATDGIYGARTKAALAAVQRANGLPATGALDDATSRLLRLSAAAAAAVPASAAAPTPAPAAVVSPAPVVSAGAGAAVAAAMSQLGVPYVAFARTPGVAFDCSGLSTYAWAQAGVSLPHQSGMQSASTTPIAKDAAQPGDLLFFHAPISHVSIYIGNGRMIHAPNAGSVVQVAAVNWNNVVGVGRPG